MWEQFSCKLNLYSIDGVYYGVWDGNTMNISILNVGCKNLKDNKDIDSRIRRTVYTIIMLLMRCFNSNGNWFDFKFWKSWWSFGWTGNWLGIEIYWLMLW